MRTYDEKFGVTLMQLWGMTETSPVASLARPPGRSSGEKAWQSRVTQGRPLFGVEMRIVDDDGTRAAQRRGVGGGVGSSRPLDHGRLLPRPGRREVRRRVACAPATSGESTRWAT